MNISSSAFENGSFIPKKFTCEGENVSPPLEISGLPKTAKSVAIICDDPDAPIGTFVHWLVWNIPPSQKIPEGAKTGVSGTAGFGKTGYGGPCPPKGHGPHRYFFKVYALDSVLELKAGADKSSLEEAMEGHIMEKAELMGKYER